ncbi:Uncharacterized protein Fot_51422 [Forsythia ovata]|uniref:Uncharacterized protein n=1 Tax=Forsythia ovata TaxID=205694 RepID=A0ABD1PVD5_9LAMI
MELPFVQMTIVSLRDSGGRYTEYKIVRRRHFQSSKRKRRRGFIRERSGSHSSILDSKQLGSPTSSYFKLISHSTTAVFSSQLLGRVGHLLSMSSLYRRFFQ